jgi:hypothetical protein
VVNNGDKFWIKIVVFGALVAVIVFGLSIFQRDKKAPSDQEVKSTDFSGIPIAVSAGYGADWFESWAQKDDILIVFGEEFDFSETPQPSVGKVGWNVPNFSSVARTEDSWEDKVDVIIYDYETWEKTPEEEKRDSGYISRQAQEYVNERGMELIYGTSWQVAVRKISAQKVTEMGGDIVWEEYIDEDKIRDIVRNVNNFGVNATALRREFPESYVDFFNTVAEVAKEANPEIKLWPVVNAVDQSAREMFQMIEDLGDNVDGVAVMSGRQDKETVEEFISLLRQ